MGDFSPVLLSGPTRSKVDRLQMGIVGETAEEELVFQAAEAHGDEKQQGVGNR